MIAWNIYTRNKKSVCVGTEIDWRIISMLLRKIMNSRLKQNKHFTNVCFDSDYMIDNNIWRHYVSTHLLSLDLQVFIAAVYKYIRDVCFTVSNEFRAPSKPNPVVRLRGKDSLFILKSFLDILSLINIAHENCKIKYQNGNAYNNYG